MSPPYPTLPQEERDPRALESLRHKNHHELAALTEAVGMDAACTQLLLTAAEISDSVPVAAAKLRACKLSANAQEALAELETLEAALAAGGEARLSPPKWASSRYRVTLTRTAGRWMISNLQLIEQIEE